MRTFSLGVSSLLLKNMNKRKLAVGNKNPNWRGGFIDKICENNKCSKVFKIRPSKLIIGEGKFCSLKCSLLKLHERNVKKHITYSGIHSWIRDKLGLASLAFSCQDINCKGNGGRLEWSNVSGKYKKELSDWMIRCKTCHAKYDCQGEKLINFVIRMKKGGGGFKKGYIPWNKGITGYKKRYRVSGNYL